MEADLFSLAGWVALITGAMEGWGQAIAMAYREAGARVVVTGRDSVLDLSEEGWDEVLDSNLKGAFFCAKHAARARIAAGDGGKIVNLGSMYSVFGHPTSIGYAASKKGLLGLTRSLAAELGPRGIQVNALLPGWFLTDMNADLPGSPRGEEIRRRTPAGQWGNGRDLAGAAIFLASRASDFVTGAAIPVDDGYHVSDRAIHPA